MSNQWIFFPCQMGEHHASIFYDHGIRDSIDTVLPRQLLKVQVAFKQPRSDGMPTNDEFHNLTALEDGLQALLQQQESIYVGRVTVNAHRHFYIYTPDSRAEEWSVRLHALGESYGYALTFVLTADESHRGYWDDLYPTDDDWQVIKDLRVIEALEKEGDDGTSTRCIDHWAYFPSQSTAEQFSQWAKQNGYSSATSDITNEGEVQVRFSHEGTVRLPDITSHTIALRQRASELGGDYDGWETPVCKTTA